MSDDQDVHRSYRLYCLVVDLIKSSGLSLSECLCALSLARSDIENAFEEAIDGYLKQEDGNEPEKPLGGMTTFPLSVVLDDEAGEE